MLYWNEIYTIFPQTYSTRFDQIYQTRTEREFSDAGLLLALEVFPSMPEIEGLLGDVLKFLETPEGKAVLDVQKTLMVKNSHRQELQKRIHEQDLVELHTDKLSVAILHQLKRKISGDWIQVDKRFADFYMTLLATRLAEKNEAGLLTYAHVFNTLANTARADAPVSSMRDQNQINIHLEKLIQNSHYRYRRAEPAGLAQGMLANLVIEQIKVDPDTPVKKILDFRTKHASELGRFRVKISELTAHISEDLPPEQLHQRVKDIYINEVKPAISDLKKGLTDSLISWGTKNTLTIGGLDSSTGSLALLGSLHLTIPYTLIAEAGILVSLPAFQFNRERAESLRKNPYSFVLEAKHAFHRKNIRKLWS